MTRALVITAIVAALAAPASFAVAPATDLYLPSVGHAQGACPGGVCSQWRTDVGWPYRVMQFRATLHSGDVYGHRRD